MAEDSKVQQHGFAGQITGQVEQCNCHDCTQARWKTSIQGQIESAMGAARHAPADAPRKGVEFTERGLDICRQILKKEYERNPEGLKAATEALGFDEVLKEALAPSSPAPSVGTPIPNSSWKGCGHPVMLNTNHCEVCASSGEMTADEFYDMNLDVPKFHPADKAQVFTFTDRVSAHNTAAIREELDSVLADWNDLVRASGSRTNGGAVGHVANMRAELAQLRTELEALTKLPMDGTSAKDYVLSVYPRAICSGPVKMYWPGQGERLNRYIVLSSPFMSRPEGEGGSEEEAWEKAAYRLSYARLQRELAQLRKDYAPPETRPTWIPVEERLPEPRTWVIGAMLHDGATNVSPVFGKRDSRSGKWRWDSEFTVTHWQPLPTPPEAAPSSGGKTDDYVHFEDCGCEKCMPRDNQAGDKTDEREK